MRLILFLGLEEGPSFGLHHRSVVDIIWPFSIMVAKPESLQACSLMNYVSARYVGLFLIALLLVKL